MIKQAYFRGLTKAAGGYDRAAWQREANAVAKARSDEMYAREIAYLMAQSRRQMLAPQPLRTPQSMLITPAWLSSYLRADEQMQHKSDAQSKTIPNANPWKKAVDVLRGAGGAALSGRTPGGYGLEQLRRRPPTQSQALGDTATR